jgi:hypothetical protein
MAFPFGQHQRAAAAAEHSGVGFAIAPPELSSRRPSQHLYARPEPAPGQRRFWLLPGAGSAMARRLGRGTCPARTRAARKPNVKSCRAGQGSRADFICTPRRLGHVRRASHRYAGATGAAQEALQSSCQAPATASDFSAHAWQRPVAA